MVDFSAGAPLATNIQMAYDKIDGICDQLGDQYTFVGCAPIVTTLDLSDDCIDLANPLATEFPQPSIEDKKIIVLSVQPGLGFTISGSEDGNPPDPWWRLIITCAKKDIINDAPVYTDEITLYSSGQIFSDEPETQSYFGDCPRDHVIRVCLEQGVSGGDISSRPDSRIELCGFVICVGDVDRISTGIFKAPPLPAGCCYTREDLCLISQNLDAICRSLIVNRDQLATCQQQSLTTPGSVLLAGNVATQTEYIVTGFVEVCVTNTDADRDWVVSLRPLVGCSSDRSQCSTRIVTVRRETSVCIRVPVNACGTCPAGESIYAGLIVENICDPDESSLFLTNGIELDSVEQDYCAWLFTRSDVSALPQPTELSLGTCLTADKLLPVQEKCEALDEFMAARTPTNCTRRNLGAFLASNADEYVIQPALPWPPITTPPTTGPAPVKKWNLYLKACIDVDRSDIFTQATIRATANIRIEVKCGGAVIATASNSRLVYQVGGSAGEDRDQILDFGILCVDINQCVECDIDQDLSFCVFGELVEDNFTNTQLPIQVTSAKMFCF